MRKCFLLPLCLCFIMLFAGTAMAATVVEGEVPIVYETGNMVLASLHLTEATQGSIETGNIVSITLPAGFTFQKGLPVSGYFTCSPDLSIAISISSDDRKLTLHITRQRVQANTHISIHLPVVAREPELGAITVTLDTNTPALDAGSYTVGIHAAPLSSVFKIGTPSYQLVSQPEVFEMDTAPYIKDGRTLLPLRYAAQACGVEAKDILWNPGDKTVTLMRNNKTVSVTVGKATMKVNGSPLIMDVEPEIRDGRVMLPVSWIGRALDAEVTWEPQTKQVIITPSRNSS